MSLPKKKSRVINIDGTSYRYLVKCTHVPGLCKDDEKVVQVTIQLDSKDHGQLAQFVSDYTVTPGFMRTVILDALKQGWKPEEKLPLFNFKYVEPKEFVVALTMKEALEVGIVSCDNCMHLPNNHWDYGKKPCAHCNCKEYVPYFLKGSPI